MTPIIRIITKNVVLSLPPEPPFDPATASCDFEAGFCHYTLDNVAGSSWRRVSVKHNIFRNGDHTTGAGGIMLIIMIIICGRCRHDVITSLTFIKGQSCLNMKLHLNRATFLTHCGQNLSLNQASIKYF